MGTLSVWPGKVTGILGYYKYTKQLDLKQFLPIGCETLEPTIVVVMFICCLLVYCFFYLVTNIFIYKRIPHNYQFLLGSRQDLTIAQFKKIDKN